MNWKNALLPLVIFTAATLELFAQAPNPNIAKALEDAGDHNPLWALEEHHRNENHASLHVAATNSVIVRWEHTGQLFWWEVARVLHLWMFGDHEIGAGIGVFTQNYEIEHISFVARQELFSLYWVKLFADEEIIINDGKLRVEPGLMLQRSLKLWREDMFLGLWWSLVPTSNDHHEETSWVWIAPRLTVGVVL